jgi:hypothetical protein
MTDIVSMKAEEEMKRYREKLQRVRATEMQRLARAEAVEEFNMLMRLADGYLEEASKIQKKFNF